MNSTDPDPPHEPNTHAPETWSPEAGPLGKTVAWGLLVLIGLALIGGLVLVIAGGQ